MATARFRGQQIKPRTPAIDARNVDQLFVVDGRNYSFDSRGPKTDFGDRYLSYLKFRKPTDIHGTRIAGRTFVHTPDALLEWDDAFKAWIPCYYFFQADNAPPRSLNGLRWNAAYINNRIFLGHRDYGYLYVETTTPESSRVFYEISFETVPGLPENPLGVVETNGRLCILTANLLAWSGPAAGLDFTPEAGGAGFQIIADKIGGTPVSVTSFAGGLVVWTTTGALLGEFIGGDNVFRWSVINTANVPQNSFCVARLNADDTLLLTNQGLFITKRAGIQEPYQPVFNEYLRDFLTVNPQAVGRLEYDSYRDRIYVLLRSHHVQYHRMFVLTPTLDAFGEFSEKNFGILPLTPTQFGYVGIDGIARYWLETGSRQDVTLNSYNYQFPRFLKYSALNWSQEVGGPEDRLSEWSTSGVCQHDSHANNIREGYYELDADVPAKPVLKGLNAYIDIGYIRPEMIQQAADGLIEVHEVALGSYPQAIPAMLEPGTIEFDYYAEIYEPLYATTEDLDESADDEEDLNGDGEDEEYNGLTSAYNQNPYTITLGSSDDGYNYTEHEPKLVRFNPTTTRYSCFTSGNLHRLRLAANETWERVHVRYLEFTLNYGGRLL